LTHKLTHSKTQSIHTQKHRTHTHTHTQKHRTHTLRNTEHKYSKTQKAHTVTHRHSWTHRHSSTHMDTLCLPPLLCRHANPLFCYLTSGPSEASAERGGGSVLQTPDSGTP